MKRKSFILVLYFGCFLTLTGCWSQKELTDLAIISAMGIDLTENGEYASTLQIINPSNVAGGLQGGGAGQGPPVSIYTATGSSIIEMNQRASKKLPRRRYYAHTNVLVIGEELARKEGITGILDAIERHQEFRMTAVIIIAHGVKASDLLKVLTPVDKIPANKIIKNLRFTEEQWGEVFTLNLQDVKKDMTAVGKSPVISGFSIEGDPVQGSKMENVQTSDPETTLSATGLAIFKEGKLVDWIDGKTARGTVLILDKIKNTGISFDWKDKKDVGTFQVIRMNSKNIATMKKGKPKITVEVKAEGYLSEIRTAVNLTDPKILIEMEDTIEKTIKEEILLAVEEGKKVKSDIFGFGQVFHQNHPKEWQKLKAEWHDVHFPELTVDVNVEVYIRRTGLRNNPSVLKQ
ncbi:Ger(x)C family spore germination protein [Mesobacillus maritimus]|uniref:Ger(x)C family spore germination protein n=1 Tax=Mesobacillus maritimus TaxID=1643336 RepID=UPI00203D0A7A|nr:Ger(x)C family spore germination protein [Mesobacillus maritimus]MCM3584562.1 Ger(x)C family spore germination protein [Mesobacillus maritimus]MCM3670637.1 Ger(x)C family spore germination protein [Mesobacillus maritimus]